MNGTQTIEVRWFYRGNVPEQVVTWFNAIGTPLPQPDSRSDCYLQSRATDLGIKVRQGNLEVKYCQQQLGAIEIAGIGDSRVQQWTKWICHNRSLELVGGEQQAWIEVAKIRSQRFYSVEFVDPIRSIPISAPRENAAAIEVTQLQLHGQPWWTIACEYLGDNISIQGQFLPLVRSLLLGYPVLASAPVLSDGYPQWLQTTSNNLSNFTG
jgi:hypothetical protein